MIYPNTCSCTARQGARARPARDVWLRVWSGPFWRDDLPLILHLTSPQGRALRHQIRTGETFHTLLYQYPQLSLQ